MVNKTKSFDEKQTEVITVRCTKKESERWGQMAKEHGVTISKMIRAAMDGNRVNSRVDAQMVAELRRQGGLLKKLLQDNPVLDSDLQIRIRETLSVMIKTMNILMRG